MMNERHRARDARHRTWLRGYIAALAALAPFNQDTIYDTVVREGEEEAMIYQARRDGAMGWSGLTGYVRRTKA